MKKIRILLDVLLIFAMAFLLVKHDRLKKVNADYVDMVLMLSKNQVINRDCVEHHK